MQQTRARPAISERACTVFRTRARSCVRRPGEGGGRRNVMSPDHAHEGLSIDRRRLLCGGGSALFGSLVASLLGGAKPVRAEPLSGAVPEIDGLAIRVVTDSYQFAVAPSRKSDMVDIQ